ncbi:arylamine N-acetyltransferase family protein [Haloarchaeobius salinus]|uniref:arylamine N-acetyltransferase family protein n=1 Tax=Haloarchaeobius salinus TaxID=1198298 RepID=UPI00210A693A|nr:arylamine N-acetyltransferase [Haloarchaeobius salinus]
MDTDRYLERIGVDPTTVTPGAIDLDTVARLQHAHVGAVPFENLAIVGDPFDDATDGEGVVLDLGHIHEKVVERRLGGYCFELNGLFGWLLGELGVDTHRVAARVVGDDGTGRPPANHHTNVVTFDRRFLVDVGMGIPTMRRPLPVDGEVVTDSAGVAWRVVESDRPDETHLTQYRRPGEAAWRDRYLFTDVPRELSYFEATCDYLQSAPESPFTGEPVVSVATDTGHVKLKRDTLVRYEGNERSEEPVAAEDWHDVLARRFGLQYRTA